MKDILVEFKDYCEHPYKRAAELKSSGSRKIIGILPMYFPEEIVHAAGAVPVTLFGSDEPITLGDSHMMTNACDQVRSSFDSLLKGKYSFVDGVAAISVCDQVRFFLEIWQLDHPVSYFHQMWRPHKLDSTNRIYLVSELKRLISSLEKFTGKKITNEALQSSIRLYNESRAMMRKLNSLRKERPGIISASDFVRVVASSMLIPREDHNALLKQLIQQLENAAAPAGKKQKVVILGHPCAIPETELLDLIEDNGLTVVDDDFFTGCRYFAKDISPDGDPVEAFADAYMNSIPCTTIHYADNWTGGEKSCSPYADYGINMAKDVKAGGIVVLKEMYCDPYDLEFVMMKERFEKENIPHLAIITEHGPGPLEAVRTRIQAFEETLRFS